MAECLKRKEDAVRRERLNRPGEGVDYAEKDIRYGRNDRYEETAHIVSRVRMMQ